MYVSDMIALEKNIENAVAGQCDDRRVKADAQVLAVLQRVHRSCASRLHSLEKFADVLGTEMTGGIKEAVAAAAGVLAGLYDQIRCEPVSRMLRDDYTALCLASVSYTMLHTTAHWQPTIHGYSGIRRPLHDMVYRELTKFPEPQTVRLLRELGVTHVVVHGDRYPADRWPDVKSRLDQTPALHLAHSDGMTSVYTFSQR